MGVKIVIFGVVRCAERIVLGCRDGGSQQRFREYCPVGGNEGIRTKCGEYSGVGTMKERIGLLVGAVVFFILCIPAGKFCTTTINPIEEARHWRMDWHFS